MQHEELKVDKLELYEAISSQENRPCCPCDSVIIVSRDTISLTADSFSLLYLQCCSSCRLLHLMMVLTPPAHCPQRAVGRTHFGE